MMTSEEIRNSFIGFFLEKNHQFVRSSPVVPFDDPTLLFINAGMNQFKPIFLGEKTPQFSRVVNSQKCIRVSGKHNDLEEVGLDTFHHTFFEMLGNWSFGDYYKAEAIQWAWELFTNVWKLDKERLWATVYKEDDEAFELWKKLTDINPSRVLKFGKKDNFWEMGDTGPCGPCSEIHYYIGDDPGKQSPDGVNQSDDYWELWNLVFIQHNRLKNGQLETLSQTHVDTGAGLERIVSVIQGKTSNYETDLFMEMIHKIESLTGKNYVDTPVPFQVIADHLRMLSFSIADGALPSNEGRGYVLRRILRRAARFGRLLDQHEPFIYQVVSTLCDEMGKPYPELIDKKVHIEKVIKSEEISFGKTLDRGMIHFERMLSELSGDTIPGAEAFKLYDTYGFPLDLTQLMAREKDLKIDVGGFNQAMEIQKKRAKGSGKFKREIKNFDWTIITEGKDSTFLGYKTLSSNACIRRYAFQEEHILIVLDETPFYAESGGQVGDKGLISCDGIDLSVIDVQKEHDVFIHLCTGDFDETKAGNEVFCSVEESRRLDIMKNHTATHLMHRALKDVLGEHVNQAGSLVHPNYLRFDLTHYEKIKSEELLNVEEIVNIEIIKNILVETTVKDYALAKQEGAMAIFGEKYGDKVRVLSIGGFSKELCGGTHVKRTGDIGLFKILEESSLASGVRRIVAVTGSKAVKLIQNQSTILEDLQQKFACSTDDVVMRVEQLITQKRQLEKELKEKKLASTFFDVKKEIELGTTFNWGTLVIYKDDTASQESLKQFGDQLLSAMDSGIGILASGLNEKPAVVIVVTKNLIARGIAAPVLAKEIGSILGGGGGGRPHLATAGGKDNKLLDHALKEAKNIVKKVLKG